MRGVAIIMDMVFSVFIFLTLVYFLGSVWNSLVQELDRQEIELLHLRTQQTLTYLAKNFGGRHQLDQEKVEYFVNQAKSNYTEVKNQLGLEDSDFNFLVKGMDGSVLYNTNNTAAGLVTVTSVRYAMMGQPVKLELWVWK